MFKIDDFAKKWPPRFVISRAARNLRGHRHIRQCALSMKQQVMKKQDGKSGRGASGKKPGLLSFQLPVSAVTLVDRLASIALQTQPIPQRLLTPAEFVGNQNPQRTRR
jgi:hypothetical protein